MKIFIAILQRIMDLFTQKLSLSSQKYGLGSEILSIYATFDPIHFSLNNTLTFKAG
jgi:hypothetical protein